jgi:hypothetical protein
MINNMSLKVIVLALLASVLLAKTPVVLVSDQ